MDYEGNGKGKNSALEYIHTETLKNKEKFGMFANAGYEL